MANNRKTYLGGIINMISAHLHFLVLLLSSVLIITSPWIVLGRRLRDNASVWDIGHVYIGLVASVFACLFCVVTCREGKWRQFFPWLLFDFGQIVQDIKGLVRGQVPVAGGKGLFSFIEGLGLIILLATAFTGCVWFLLQGSPEALDWRRYHHLAAYGFIGFVGVHLVFSLLHLLDFIRN